MHYNHALFSISLLIVFKRIQVAFESTLQALHEIYADIQTVIFSLCSLQYVLQWPNNIYWQLPCCTASHMYLAGALSKSLQQCYLHVFQIYPFHCNRAPQGQIYWMAGNISNNFLPLYMFWRMNQVPHISASLLSSVLM